jgi:hypothetical protein
VGSCIRDITFFQLNLFHAFCDYDSCSQLIAADKIQILHWEYYFKQPSLHFLYAISVLECVRLYHDFQEIWPHFLYSINTYPKSVMSLSKDQTLLFSTYHSNLVFRKSCVQISHKWLVTLTDTVWAFYCKLSYYCFLPSNKIWIFVSWNIWSMWYSISWTLCMWVQNTGKSR